MISNNNKLKLRLGDIYKVDLPKQNGYCLSGIHKCIIIKRFGSTVQVVPISSNRSNLHYGELPLDNGKYGLTKESKLKVGQLTSVSIERIVEYVDHADRQTLVAIKDFIKVEIVDFINKVA